VIMIALERFWAVNGVGALISTRFWSFGLGKSMFYDGVLGTGMWECWLCRKALCMLGFSFRLGHLVYLAYELFMCITNSMIPLSKFVVILLNEVVV